MLGVKLLSAFLWILYSKGVANFFLVYLCMQMHQWVKFISYMCSSKTLSSILYDHFSESIIHLSLSLSKYIYIYIYIYVHVCVCVCVHIYIYVYICVYVCMYVCVCGCQKNRKGLIYLVCNQLPVLHPDPNEKSQFCLKDLCHSNQRHLRQTLSLESAVEIYLIFTVHRFKKYRWSESWGRACDVTLSVILNLGQMRGGGGGGGGWWAETRIHKGCG